MPRWITITIDTLYEAKVAALINAASTAAKADNQDDRVPGIIQGVVDEIRRKIASCNSNQLDSDVTKIPNGLRDIAVDMVIARLKKAIEQELSEDERRSMEKAERDLNRIANCDDVVEQPDDPIDAPVQGGAATQLVRPGRLPGDRTHPFAGL